MLGVSLRGQAWGSGFRVQGSGLREVWGDSYVRFEGHGLVQVGLRVWGFWGSLSADQASNAVESACNPSSASTEC